jgi:hypothetical protein
VRPGCLCSGLCSGAKASRRAAGRCRRVGELWGPHLSQPQLVTRGQQLRVLQALQPAGLGMVCSGSAGSRRVSWVRRRTRNRRHCRSGSARGGAVRRARERGGGGAQPKRIRSVAPSPPLPSPGCWSGEVSGLGSARGPRAHQPLRAASRGADCVHRGDAAPRGRPRGSLLTCFVLLLPAAELDSQLQAAACGRRYLRHSARAVYAALQPMLRRAAGGPRARRSAAAHASRARPAALMRRRRH